MEIRKHLRLIWTVASKDILDALQNKVLFGVMAGVALMMISSQLLGLLVRGQERSIAFYFDPGGSELLEAAARSEDLILVKQNSREQLLESVGASAEAALGLEIPPDLDRLVRENAAITLTAYRPYWLPADEALVLVDSLENLLAQALGAQIRLATEGHIAYAQYDSKGYPEMIARGMVMGVMLIGLILTPYLIVDEKTERTLDALLLSPATYFHMLAGKVIAGIVYSLAGSLLIFLFSWRRINGWENALLAISLGALCAASIGLLMGTLFNTSTGVNMLESMLIFLLLLPLFLLPKLTALLGPAADGLLNLLPSIPMYRLMRLSLAEHRDFSLTLLNSLVLAGTSILFLALAAWRIRLLDR